ncbi:hypothetical protein E4T56_gene1662 [Termitomyces sp. T112]|nr:hypothetical protein E4T56_gene1662 [Termitomyces sp. T112]
MRSLFLIQKYTITISDESLFIAYKMGTHSFTDFKKAALAVGTSPPLLPPHQLLCPYTVTTLSLLPLPRRQRHYTHAQPRGTFQFQQKNHTVTQSSFADPCRMLATGGFVIIVTRLTTDG